MRYNVGVLQFELVKAGLKIEGVDSNGNISWINDPTDEDLAKAQEILDAHDPTRLKTVQVNPLKDILKAVVVRKEDGFDFTIAEDIDSMIKNSKVGYWFQSVLALETASFDRDLIEMLEERIAIEIGEGTLGQESANLLAAALYKVKKGLA